MEKVLFYDLDYALDAIQDDCKNFYQQYRRKILDDEKIEKIKLDISKITPKEKRCVLKVTNKNISCVDSTLSRALNKKRNATKLFWKIACLYSYINELKEKGFYLDVEDSVFKPVQS